MHPQRTSWLWEARLEKLKANFQGRFCFAIPNLTWADTLRAMKSLGGSRFGKRGLRKGVGMDWNGSQRKSMLLHGPNSPEAAKRGWYSSLYCVFASGRPAIEVKQSVSRQASFRCLFSFPYGSEDPPQYTVSGAMAKSPKIQSVKVAVLWNHSTGWVCQPIILHLFCFSARFAVIFTQLSGILDFYWSVALFCQIFLFNGH